MLKYWPVIASFALTIMMIELCAASSAASQVATNEARGDEFIGPFSSWLDLKRDFGAKGDGASDDTLAWQNALDAVGNNGRSPVLYIPSGTYLISRPLLLLGGIYVSVVGEDPAATILKWGGGSKGAILQIDGVAYSRFIRLTFDGGGTAEMAVSQSERTSTVSSSRRLG